MSLARVGVAVALAGGLVACSPAASEPAPPPMTTSSSPSPPAPSPSTEPTPEATPTPDETDDDPNDRSELLEQPEAMENDDEEGAIAAAKYYMGLYDYAYLTGDLEAWEELAHPSCQFCQVVADGVREIHEAGGHLSGDPPRWIGEPEVELIEFENTYEVTLRAKVGATAEYDANGDVVEQYESGRNRVTVGASYQQGEWSVVGIVISDDR